MWVPKAGREALSGLNSSNGYQAFGVFGAELKYTGPHFPPVGP